MQDLIVIGAGGFGRETIDVVRAINVVTPSWNLLGVVDDAPSPDNLARLEALGVQHLGGLANLPDTAAVVISVGRPEVRQRIHRVLQERRLRYPSLVHPTVTFGSQFHHGDGLVALAGVSIGTNVTLGEHVHLNGHSVLGHDATCHDFVSINPNATLSGDCVVGSGTLLGANSTVLQQISVGSRVTVGAAACVTRAIPDDSTVVGIPARPLTKDNVV